MSTHSALGGWQKVADIEQDGSDASHGNLLLISPAVFRLCERARSEGGTCYCYLSPCRIKGSRFKYHGSQLWNLKRLQTPHRGRTPSEQGGSCFWPPERPWSAESFDWCYIREEHVRMLPHSRARSRNPPTAVGPIPDFAFNSP